MRLSDDFDDRGSGMPVVYMAIGAFLFVATIFGIVIFMNQRKSGGGNGQTIPPVVSSMETAKKAADITADAGASDRAGDSADATADSAYGNGTGLVSDDLDFWHMYDEAPETEASGRESEIEESESGQDPSTDGKHTRIVDEDGTEEWVGINPYLTRNKYNFEGLVYQYPIMKYYEDSKKGSTVGVWVSEEDGENINFGLLKKAGVDFAMIRIGSRGYGSGNIQSDSMFYENVRRATEAGMDIGVSFYSQAVTEDEAAEEAMRVIEGLQGFTIVYPIAFDMEYVRNDTARVQRLSRNEKTKIATKFMDTVASYGYKPILYGNKDWLIRKVDLSKLIGYDTWLSQPGDTPDYPYKFTMWEYAKDARINGMEEPASLSICFINYAAK